MSEVITVAMVWFLVGTPLRSDGQLTIKSFAQEAGLKRNELSRADGPVLRLGARAGLAAEGRR
ncbi:hypothetical protein ACFZA1_32785 [Streptomyces filipinensis]|uniref:hypothetical protein n=1 Tax=Streptomyces filipinensis TaxID=66887 RepID=UPI0036E99A00